MATRAQLVSYINSNIVTNGQQAITGDSLNEILILFTSSFLVPDTDFPLVPSKGGTGVANSDSNTITIGGDVTIASTLSTTGTFSSGGNFSTGSTFSATGAVSIGSTLSTTPAFTVSGANALVLTTSGTGTTTVTFFAGTYTVAGLSLNQTFTGSNNFTGTTDTFSSNVVFQTGTSTFSNGFSVSGGTVTITPGLTSGNITMNDARNFIFNTTTGTKIGTDAAQKIGFWNAAPVVRQSTAIAAAAFVANSSGIADDTATFGGYTLGQVVAALRLYGLLA